MSSQNIEIIVPVRVLSKRGERYDQKETIDEVLSGEIEPFTANTSKKCSIKEKNPVIKRGKSKNIEEKKSVVFKKSFVEIINVENWKRYNVDISELPGESDKEKTKCTCIIL